ncbi:MAG TPA: NAD(P)H-dependent glycerol-3-phosphate dehydrogenase [Acetobacteraceae bacterium]|nr:NAD(P)H-dependent glycerol-3-phosphate dehydrogenase [Acetobacteraceae bacterium]
MNERFDIAVLGTGAWGTALALLAAKAGRRAALVGRDAGRVAELAGSRRNPRLPDAVLPPGLAVTASCPDAEILILCPPFQHLRHLLARMPPGISPLVLASKGVEAGTGMLGPEIVAALHPGRPVAVLTGPNFAHEIAAGMPAAGIAATTDAALRASLLRALATPGFRLYGSGDPMGAALAGAAKNVIAIAAGAVMGAALGENARAALVTRGLAEIARLAPACGGQGQTIAGLAGLGDLLLTCTGPASRNYAFGLAIGRGEAPAALLARSAGVVEGAATAPALLARAASHGIEMPITAAVVSLLEGRATLAETMRGLLSRAVRDE